MEGTSNSWKTFKGTQSGSQKWSDPEFKADEDSLYWKYRSWGRIMDNSRITDGYRLPGGARAWKRPEEYSPGTKPSLWGEKGVLPTGVV